MRVEPSGPVPCDLMVVGEAKRRNLAYKAAWLRRWRKTGKGKAANRARIVRNRELLRLAKDNPCADCGREYPYYVMDFDHARGTKRFEIRAGLTKTVRMLLSEIAKCDVVCSNCHRERTHQRGEYARRS